MLFGSKTHTFRQWAGEGGFHLWPTGSRGRPQGRMPLMAFTTQLSSPAMSYLLRFLELPRWCHQLHQLCMLHPSMGAFVSIHAFM